MNISALIDYIRRNYQQATVPRNLLVSLYYKMLHPVTVMIMLIFAVIFGIKMKEGSMKSSIGSNLVIYISYFGLSNFTLSLGNLGKINPFISVWMVPICFIIFAVYLSIRKFSMK